jgi:hypothetical protein
MAPLAIFGALVMLIAANSAQLHLIDAVYAKQREAPEAGYGRAYSRLGTRTAIQPDAIRIPSSARKCRATMAWAGPDELGQFDTCTGVGSTAGCRFLIAWIAPHSPRPG